MSDKKIVHIRSVILFSFEKIWNLAVCNLDRIRQNHTSPSVSENKEGKCQLITLKYRESTKEKKKARD